MDAQCILRLKSANIVFGRCPVDTPSTSYQEINVSVNVLLALRDGGVGRPSGREHQLRVMEAGLGARGPRGEPYPHHPLPGQATKSGTCPHCRQRVLSPNRQGDPGSAPERPPWWQPGQAEPMGGRRMGQVDMSWDEKIHTLMREERSSWRPPTTARHTASGIVLPLLRPSFCNRTAPQSACLLGILRLSTAPGGYQGRDSELSFSHQKTEAPRSHIDPTACPGILALPSCLPPGDAKPCPTKLRALSAA